MPDLEALRQAPSTTPRQDRPHCPECGSIQLSRCGTAIFARAEGPYRCKICGYHGPAREDTVDRPTEDASC